MLVGRHDLLAEELPQDELCAESLAWEARPAKYWIVNPSEDGAREDHLIDARPRELVARRRFQSGQSRMCRRRLSAS